MLNATVTEPSSAGYLTVWPSGVVRPDISNLNFQPNQTIANLVTVRVGDDGRVSVFNPYGTTHVVFDVVGYYSSLDGPSGSRFHGVNPHRYFDTRFRRDSNGVVLPLRADDTLSFTFDGGDFNDATRAVLLNVTVTEPTADGYLTVYPGDVPRPVASNINFRAGSTVPNLVLVRLPHSGVVNFYNGHGTTHVIADVVGVFDLDKRTDAGRFIALSPSRTLDTRLSNQPLHEAWSGSLGMAGYAGVPASGADAVAVNVTAVGPTKPGYLIVFPDDVCELPNSSNVNFMAGQTVPNLVMVRLSESAGTCAVFAGAIEIFNQFGSVHVLVDVFGYFTDANAFVKPTSTATSATRSEASGARTGRWRTPLGVGRG